MANYKYLLLAEKLKNEILSSLPPPGKKLSTEDELMTRHSMSRNTVRQAVTLLAEQGFLVKIQGSGTFVSERITEYRDKIKNAKKNKCIGVVMNQVNSYIFPEVLMGISDYLFEHDYYMIIRMTLNQIAKEKQVLTELLASNVAGIIVEPARSGFPTVNHELYREIEKKHSCVLIHASLPGFSFHSVNNTNVEGYAILVDHLAKRGHRDIVAICKFDEESGVKRFLGFVEGLRRNDLPIDEGHVLWFADEDFDDMFSDVNAHRVMKVIGNCTAVMCFNDDVAARFLLFLKKRGMRVPEDLSVVGFDDLQRGNIERPLTTVEHPKRELGRAAAKAILTLIDNPFADVSVHFTPRLIDRDSVAWLTRAPTAATS